MIYLHTSTTAPGVKSFWIVTAMVWAGLTSLGYFTVLSSIAFPIGSALFAAAFAAFAFVCPSILERVCKSCAALIRNRLVALVRGWVVIIAFVFVIFPNRLFGGSRADVAEETTWMPKQIRDLRGGGGSRDVVVDDLADASWLGALCKWCRETRNRWVLGLVPYMLLLAVLDVGRKRESQSNETYTLY